MAIDELAFQLIQALGSLGSMLGGVHAAKQLSLAEQQEAIEQILAAERLDIINESLVGNITGRIQGGVKRLSDAYDNPANNRQDIEKEKTIAKHEICNALQDIKEMNNGELPGKYLKDQWESFGCSSYSS